MKWATVTYINNDGVLSINRMDKLTLAFTDCQIIKITEHK